MRQRAGKGSSLPETLTGGRPVLSPSRQVTYQGGGIMLDVIDPQRVYRELSELAGYYLEGQNPDFLLSRIRFAVKRLQSILPADPEICEGVSTEALCSLSDFVRHATALYLLDDPAGLSDPPFFSPYLAEELRCLVARFRPAVDLPPEQTTAPESMADLLDDPPEVFGSPLFPPERPSKEALALAVLADHPDWTDKKIAEAAGCNRTSLYDFPKYQTAREILRKGKNDLPRGSKYRDKGIEALDNEGDG